MHKVTSTAAHVRRDVCKLPIATFVIHDRLEALIRSVTPHYLTKLDVRIVSAPLDQLQYLPNKLSALKETSIFIGSALIEPDFMDAECAPMIAFHPSLADVLQALIAVQPHNAAVKIILNNLSFPELAETRALFNMSFEQYSYTSLEDAKGYIDTVSKDTSTVVIGDSISVAIAEKAGLKAVLVCTQSTIRTTLEKAMLLVQQKRERQALQDKLMLLTQHLSDGVMRIDGRDQIISINPAMAELLEVPLESAIGKLLAYVCPSLTSIPTTRHDEQQPLHSIRIGKKSIHVSRLSSFETGQDSGSTFVCRKQASSLAGNSLPSLQQRIARYRLEHIVGHSPAINDVRLLSAQYAKVDSTVLLTGESGTGKELFAQGIHNASQRHAGPFVAINCAALPESLLESELFGFEEGAFTGSKKGGKPGLFEAANGGTIFLDEIGDMPMQLQTRLLRVLQEREVVHIGGNEPIPIDIRVIAATNMELQKAVGAGRFRGDLYYRLNVCSLHLPPLRERQVDIPILAMFIMEKTLHKFSTTRSALEILTPILPMLTRYPWPGNIREMENVIERLAVRACSEVTETDGLTGADNLRLVVPELFAESAKIISPASAPLQLHQTVRTNEAGIISSALSAYHGNRTLTAKALGISRATLWRKLQVLSVPVDKL